VKFPDGAAVSITSLAQASLCVKAGVIVPGTSTVMLCVPGQLPAIEAVTVKVTIPAPGSNWIVEVVAPLTILPATLVVHE